MEISVWTRHRWFALGAVIGLSLSSSLSEAQRPRSSTLSQDAPKIVATSTSTLRKAQTLPSGVLTIKRETMAKGESRFGVMAYEGKTVGYTLEHESVKIPAGTYRGEIRWSERFQENVPYIHVPSRSGIEIHVGNCPRDSGGCVLVGEEAHGACLDNSRSAFERMMKVLPQEFIVVVE